MLRAIAATVLALALLAGPAAARDLESAERAEIRAALDAYESAIARGEYDVMVDNMPEELLAVIGADFGVDAATAREAFRQELPRIFADARLLENDFGMPVEEGVLGDGTRYQIINTTTIVQLVATGQRFRSSYPTLVLDRDGVWRLVALDSPETIAQFRRAFPAFGTVDIPQGRFEPLAD